MGKSAKEFLMDILRFQNIVENPGAGSTTAGYIVRQINKGVEAEFETQTADGGGVQTSTNYDATEHPDFASWSSTPIETDGPGLRVPGTNIRVPMGGTVGLLLSGAEHVLSGGEDPAGTETGQEVREAIANTFKIIDGPAMYGGCSGKAMVEILGPSTIANDANVWTNLQSAYAGDTAISKLLAAIASQGPAGPGDTYGTTKLKGATAAGFNPCQGFNEKEFKKWIHIMAGVAFRRGLGDVRAQQNLDLDGSLINEIALGIDAVAGAVGLDTNLGKTSKEILAENNALRKTIAAYSRVDNIKFKEQCFLLSNIQALALVKKNLETTIPKVKPDNTAAGNACVQLQGDPFGLINKLTQNAHKEEFFDMPSAALSTLQPMIRLFKVVADDTGKNERQIEIKFDSHYSTEDAKDLLTNKANRGHGVGISSFNFSYEANNPFAIKKSIKAKLVIHANNFSELLRDRNGTVDYADNPPYAKSGPVPYRYIDLAMKTWDPNGATRDMNKINPQQREVVQKNMDKLTFRLKAVVGWANPSAKTTKTSRGTWAAATGGRITPNILDAVYDSCITLNLTPTIHSFDIDEMGRVKFTLNYFAFVEDFFDSESFSIFTDPEVAVKQIARKVRYKKLGEDCDSKEVNEIKNSEASSKAIEEEKIKNFRHLMTSMLKSKKMRFMEIPLEDLSKYRQGGPLKQIDGALLKKFVESVKTAAHGTAGSGAVVQEIDAAVTAGAAAAKKDEKKTTDPASPGDDSKAKSGSTGTTPSAAQIESALNPLQTVTFFWVSDLMDVVLKNIGTTLESLPDKIKAMPEMKKDGYKGPLEEEARDYMRFSENFARFRLALGPLELLNSNAEGKVMESAFVNFGDVPISAKYFMEFLTTKILKTDKQAYPLPRFLNQFFNELVRDFLNNDTCYGNRAKQKTRMSQAAISSYKKSPPLDNITAAMGSASRLDITNYRGEQLPILDVFGERGSPVSHKDIKDETNFLIFFAARTQPTEKMRGCKGGRKHTCYDDNDVEVPGDHDRGLWHYQIGKDRGIVKTIKLEKTDSPGLAEVRFEQEGYDGLAQLRVLYDAKIKTYLDVNAYPGSYIYVEPRGFDPGALSTDLTRMGVGGYYMIIRSSHTLGPGIAETEITAKWVAEIDKKLEEIGKADEKPKEKKGKCYSGGGERKTAASAPPSAGWFSGLFGGSDSKPDGTKKP